ncbi:hypothetical protein VTK56DRAFT_9856 [Thermocarpiscus australiensis]
MAGRTRRVNFEDDRGGTRSRHHHHHRTRSAERVHSIWDDYEDMGRQQERVSSEQLLRENEILRLELEQYRACTTQLERENRDLQAQIRDLAKRLRESQDGRKQLNRVVDDVNRRIDRLRENLTAHMENERRLMDEKAALERILDLRGYRR